MASNEGDKSLFGSMNLSQIKQREIKLQNKNTVSNEDKAVACFKECLKQIGKENTDFFTYSDADLNDNLANFFFNA